MVAHPQRQGILSGVRINPLQTPHAMLAQGSEGCDGFTRLHRSIRRAVEENYVFFWQWLQGVSLARILTTGVENLAMDFSNKSTIPRCRNGSV